MVHTDVLVVGAGPVGLTAAAELRRRGVGCRVIDRLPARLPYAKAVGIQPRTLEIWDRMGMVGAALDAAVPMRGQLMYVNGAEQARVELSLPPDVPYGFAALPQYETERIIEEHLARWDTGIERGVELVSFEQDDEGVWCRITTPSGREEEVRSRFLVGCDGAHSIVRKSLGLTFEGGAFPEEYMLADVEVDWSLPAGYGVRALHRGDGATDDLLVCIPLPGRSRYRMSMLVPPELSVQRQPDGDRVAHGLESGRAPGLEHVQAVLDRLAPEPTTASALRWSSVFRISHRLVDRYSRGRVFVAGDAAHIHPPTGAQGMNTGIQDAWNLAWKLALAVAGAAGPRLLESYDAERRPVGEEVVGRTVRHATAGGVQADPEDRRTLLLREAQLLVGYRGSPVVGPAAVGHDGPDAGDRAPDCGGLLGPVATFPVRLFDALRGHDTHTLLLYADDPGSLERSARVAAETGRLTHGQVSSCLVLGADAADGGAGLPAWRDSRGEFRRVYHVTGPTGILLRPDGHVGLRQSPPAAPEFAAHLGRVLGIRTPAGGPGHAAA
ncbi:FAD-dependent monooxygenase [Streptomyces peucetius]|uniref:FAD-dependent monooxygenase n=1 Tax=Streptomyces peucetius TaxID=1950 RepID=A0ABY6IGH4_STRPE|nr:FAD-dependent monooxygenase [Streptomyces peucetius]UYQ66117.1 FAD-dependent monooxygenase [Streptomyces peucetius]